MLRGRNVLVTGATGFIGSNLTERLVSIKANVSIIRRKGSNTKNISDFEDNLNIIECDLNNFRKLRKAVKGIRTDVVFHLASDTDVSRNYKSIWPSLKNINSTLNLIMSLKSDFSQFINTGTCEEYGDNPAPFNEEQLPNPVSPYSASKVGTTYYCKMLHKVMELPIVTLRPFLTYGPKQESGMLIPDLIMSILEEKKFVMTGGKQTRDFNYVEDIVDGYIKAAESKKARGEIINIGTGKEIEVRRVVENIIKILDPSFKPQMKLPHRKGETMHFYCSNEKANRILGWKPKTTLEEGLNKTIKWYVQKFQEGEMKKWKRKK